MLMILICEKTMIIMVKGYVLLDYNIKVDKENYYFTDALDFF